MKKKLVAYFSASGKTKRAAENLAEQAGADLFEIEPLEAYTSQDLNWSDKNSRSSREAKDLDARPEIGKKVSNMDDYDQVFLGFPIWWYKAPNIILTFLESYDFSGKKIIPFATSGGSGMGKTLDQLKKACPEGNFKEGKVLNRTSKRDVEIWLESI